MFAGESIPKKQIFYTKDQLFRRKMEMANVYIHGLLQTIRVFIDII